MARNKRETRFVVLKGFYTTFLRGLMDEQAVKANVEESHSFIYESEVEKFNKTYPEVNPEEFLAWLKHNGGYKVAGKRTSTGVGRASLKSADKAVELGVLPENASEYASEVTKLFESKSKIDALIPGKKLNFYFSDIKKKEKA